MKQYENITKKADDFEVEGWEGQSSQWEREECSRRELEKETLQQQESSTKKECPREGGQRPGWECFLRISKNARVATHSKMECVKR